MLENNLATVNSVAIGPRLSNYTMGPNWIYDVLLLKESYSVAKVVLFVNRNTTGRTGREGNRVEVVQASYGCIARDMEMSLRAVGEGVRTALARGYLIQVKAGRAATENRPGEGGWYALNWNWPMLPDNSYVNLGNGGAEQNLHGVANEQVLSEEAVQILPTKAERAVQILPERAMQILPPCINKPDSDSNKLIEIEAHAREQANSTGSTPKTSSEKVEETPEGYKFSTAIGHLISDLTREFGDNPTLTRPNISRAVNLWRNTTLTEPEFMALIYQARQKTMSEGIIRHRRLTAKGDTSDLPNRMPYFFAVLSELVTSLAQELPHKTTQPSANYLPQGKKQPRATTEATRTVKSNSPVVSEIRGTARSVVTYSEPENAVEVEPVVVEVEPEEARAEPVGNSRTDLWEVVLPQLGWLSETKREALSQAELLPVADRTSTRFELRFARNWQKTIFTGWELDRIALALGLALGKPLYPGTITVSGG